MMTIGHTSTTMVRVGVCLILVLSGAALPSLGCYSAGMYRGDGRLTDHGWLAREPRYIITFPEVVVTESREYVYTFTGAPSRPMIFYLQITNGHRNDTFSNAEWDDVKLTLENAHVVVTAEVVDAAGGSVCKAEGQLPGGWKGIFGWVSSTDKDCTFYQDACFDIRLSSSVTYQLRIRVESVGASSSVTAVPYLKGGGVDWL